jgi:hypothetical protein
MAELYELLVQIFRGLSLAAVILALISEWGFRLLEALVQRLAEPVRCVSA